MNLAKIEATMTSREIADLTGKEHKHVLRDTEVMFSELGIQINGYVQNWTHPQNGQTYPEFVLPKDLTLTLVSGYNVVMRKRIIDRWLELEAVPQFKTPTTFTEALRLALSLQETIDAQTVQLEAAKPAIAFTQAVSETSSSDVGKVAKTLGYGRNTFFAMLKKDKVLMENRMPYQPYIDRGYFEVVEGDPWEDSSGSKHASFTTKITGKGQIWLFNKYGKK